MICLSESWWGGMQTAEKVYWIIALPSTAVFLFQLVLTFIGGDIDHADLSADHDVAIDSDHGIGFQFLSIKNLIGFFSILGWTGIAMINGGKSLGITIVVSTLAGLLMHHVTVYRNCGHSGHPVHIHTYSYIPPPV